MRFSKILFNLFLSFDDYFIKINNIIFIQFKIKIGLIEYDPLPEPYTLKLSNQPLVKTKT